jgi:hypothetical protein
VNDTVKVRCAGNIGYGWRSKQCKNAGSLEHESKMFCGLHHPPAEKARYEKREAAYQAEKAKRFAEWSAARDRAEEDARRLAAFPALVDALEDMFNGWRYIRETHGDLYGVGWDRAEDKARAALAAARGES